MHASRIKGDRKVLEMQMENYAGNGGDEVVDGGAGTREEAGGGGPHVIVLRNDGVQAVDDGLQGG